ncbi:MAG: GGDEF domain-containing protein [Massilia sp.]
MDSLLKHLVDITGHRDHAMLDVAVISAVHELASARRTRVLSLVGGESGPALRQRACIGCDDTTIPDTPVAALPEFAACLAGHTSSASATAPDGASLLWMPIWIGEKADTVLEIVRDGPFHPDMVPMVTGIVGVYRNFQNLLDYSERDSLTGLLNRKTFDGQLTRMLQSSGGQLASPTPAAAAAAADSAAAPGQWLVVADIDFFKSVNDRYGHVFGDEVLILVANMLVSSFRSDDRVFRFGGEEFVILLRSATRAQAHQIIERFRANLAAHVFPQVGSVTVSLGYVQVRPGDSPVASLGHADQALYYAKTHGRNQICHYDDIVAAGELQLPSTNDTAEFF